MGNGDVQCEKRAVLFEVDCGQSNSNYVRRANILMGLSTSSVFLLLYQSLFYNPALFSTLNFFLVKVKSSKV